MRDPTFRYFKEDIIMKSEVLELGYINRCPKVEEKVLTCKGISMLSSEFTKIGVLDRFGSRGIDYNEVASSLGWNPLECKKLLERIEDYRVIYAGIRKDSKELRKKLNKVKFIKSLQF